MTANLLIIISHFAIEYLDHYRIISTDFFFRNMRIKNITFHDHLQSNGTYVSV